MQRALNNWKLKLMSLVLALALWSHVRGEVNPWETATFRVPLSATPPAQIVVLNSDKVPASVRVTLRAPRSRLRELKGFTPANPLTATTETVLNSEDVRASLDFSLARLGTEDVPVKVEVRGDDIEVIGTKPGVLAVRLDRASQRTLPVEIQTRAARGYRIENATLARSTITLSGPANALAQVARVRARVRSGALRLNVPRQIQAPLEAVDAQNETVSGVRLPVATIPVRATLRQRIITRRLPIRVQISGASATQFASVQASPSRLRVRGPQLQLEKLQFLLLQIPATEISATGSTIVRRDIAFPKGISAVNSSNIRVQVLAAAPTPSNSPAPTPTTTSTPLPAATIQATEIPFDIPVRREAPVSSEP